MNTIKLDDKEMEMISGGVVQEIALELGKKYGKKFLDEMDETFETDKKAEKIEKLGPMF